MPLEWSPRIPLGAVSELKASSKSHNVLGASLVEEEPDMSILEVEQQGRVRRLRLNRPEKLNALSRELIGMLKAELHSGMDDEQTAVVVLSGAGRAFSAGADVTEAAHSDALSRRHL